MAEFEAVRQREAEPAITYYDEFIRYILGLRETLSNSPVVIKGRDAPVEHSRQGIIRWILSPRDFEEGKACVPNWRMFIHEIYTSADGITTSGQHRHQGGLGLFAIEGEGYTVVDGVRYDWQAGDFIMLPIKPNGCVHQHFSRRPGRAAKWLAVIYEPIIALTGAAFEQKKEGAKLHV
ncbi:MAG TPA: cupin domain-containing protein [Dehalococcoidia bacterium]|nr:cupin domain-containing protein [Dehalococcoidia bacterium]